jgi:hypothetical protein
MQGIASDPLATCRSDRLFKNQFELADAFLEGKMLAVVRPPILAHSLQLGSSHSTQSENRFG